MSHAIATAWSECRYEDLLREAEEFSRSAPGSVTVEYLQASAHYQLGDYARGVDVLERALRGLIGPEPAELVDPLHGLLAACLLELGCYEEAEQRGDRISSARTGAQALLASAWACHFRGRPAAAAERLSRLLDGVEDPYLRGQAALCRGLLARRENDQRRESHFLLMARDDLERGGSPEGEPTAVRTLLRAQVDILLGEGPARLDQVAGDLSSLPRSSSIARAIELAVGLFRADLAGEGLAESTSQALAAGVKRAWIAALPAAGVPPRAARDAATAPRAATVAASPKSPVAAPAALPPVAATPPIAPPAPVAAAIPVAQDSLDEWLADAPQESAPAASAIPAAATVLVQPPASPEPGVRDEPAAATPEVAQPARGKPPGLPASPAAAAAPVAARPPQPVTPAAAPEPVAWTPAEAKAAFAERTAPAAASSPAAGGRTAPGPTATGSGCGTGIVGARPGTAKPPPKPEGAPPLALQIQRHIACSWRPKERGLFGTAKWNPFVAHTIDRKGVEAHMDALKVGIRVDLQVEIPGQPVIEAPAEVVGCRLEREKRTHAVRFSFVNLPPADLTRLERYIVGNLTQV